MSKKSPSMVRSFNQLAGAYAPGSMFTFEGGAGACQAVVPQGSAYSWDALPEYVQAQSIIRINESIQSWIRRATHNSAKPVPLDLVVDPALLRDGSVIPISKETIGFVSPEMVGYSLFPLSLVCSSCDRFVHFEGFGDFERREQELFGRCHKEGEMRGCQWRQLDVVFVHPSGHIEAPRPGNYTIPETGKERWLGEECSSCKQSNWKLNRSSPQIRNWYFFCGTSGCRGATNAKERWMIYDPHTYRSLRRAAQAGAGAGESVGPVNTAQANMRVTSYRASPVFYPKSVFFVLVPESQTELQRILESVSSGPMRTWVGKRFKFHGDELTDEEIEQALAQAGKADEWAQYIGLREMLATAPEASKPFLQKALEEKMQAWTSGAAPVLEPKLSLPVAVEARLNNRSERFLAAYDPFVLAVEHEALTKGKLSDKHSFVRFSRLDINLAPRDEQSKKDLEAQSVSLMSQLGMSEAGLIRDFEVCKTTFGFTRVSSEPRTELGSQDVPVRLNMFDNVRSKGRRPAYLITQRNEALYFQLAPERVYEWLQLIDPEDLPKWSPEDDVPFGGRLLEVASSFGPFMQDLHPGPPQTYWYVYTLLHTYAHQMMRTVAYYSGLDAGSISEYLFPADLAFVVYRSGTTMDLGNMSSLWRNLGTLLFDRLLDPWTHQCNSGQLCDTGACPDCILVPETSCVASNHLLCRSVLGGGTAPREDTSHRRITGYIQMILQQRHQAAA